MRNQHRLLRLVLSVSVLSVPCWAQSELREGIVQQRLQAKPIEGPVKDLGIYHVATDTWTRATHSTANFGVDVLYNNNANTGYFSPQEESWSVIDAGRIPGTTEGNSACYEINCYQTGYCTNQANKITLEVTWYEGYAQCSNAYTGGLASTLTGPVGKVITTGLPASTTGSQMCWIVTLDFAGTGQEFKLGGDFDNVLDDPISGGYPFDGRGENQLDDYGRGQQLRGHDDDGTTG